jgi:drug/metabolite transporter (DMT)-like permease
VKRSAWLEAGASAVAFGLVGPVAKRLGQTAPPLVLVALLYLGAGLVLLAARVFVPSRAAPLTRRDAPTMLAILAVGGLVGPVLWLYGLERSGGVAASLILNLQTVFTALVAALWFHEHVGRRGAVALAAVVGGAVLAGFDRGGGGTWWGALLVAGACLCWAIDDNLTRNLSGKSAVAVAGTKTLGAGALALVAALVHGERLPPPATVAVALAAGALGVGLGLVLFVRSLRELGVARTNGVFATSPFVGALAALPILGERPGALVPVAGLLMAAGVALLLTEHHAHRHVHDPLEHAHLHTHDEHHRHPHDGSEGPEPHAHRHRHEPLDHDHPHLPDLHHRHRH